MTAKLLLVKSENGLETRQDYDGLSSANPAFTGTLTGDSAALTGSVDAGGEIKSGTLVGAGTRPVVALADGTIDDQPPATFLGTIGALAASLKGAANGVAELGADGRVPTGQLPSYVDDVLEFASFAALPGTGETGKIYITQDNNKTWRWSGTAYAEISASLALGETLATAYRGDRGKTAYDHSQATGNPHGTTAADVGALASANPNFTGNLLQDGDQRITPSGGGRFTDLSLATLAAGSDLPMVSDAAGVLRNKSAGAFRTIIAAAASDHNHFSKLEVSASTTIGSIDATAIKVTATDVNLTLSGGVDGQGWDIVCPTTSFGISIPTGVTLYAYAGSDIGPTTRAVGGGRGIRIVRIDAATWIAPNLTW